MLKYLYIVFLYSFASCNNDNNNLVSAIKFSEIISNDKSVIIIDVRTPDEFKGIRICYKIYVELSDR